MIRTHDCLNNIAERLCEVYQLVSLQDQDRCTERRTGYSQTGIGEWDDAFRGVQLLESGYRASDGI